MASLSLLRLYINIFLKKYRTVKSLRTTALACTIFCACYNVYRLVAVSLFATFALFCLQLLSIVSFGCE